MALTERNRNVLYQGLTRAVGDEEAVEAMLSQFPAGDGDRLATESFVRAEISGLRTEMTVGFADVRTEFADVRKEMAEGFADVRTEFADVRREMAEGFAEVKEYVHDEMRRWFVWSYGAMFLLLAAVVTAAKILE